MRTKIMIVLALVAILGSLFWVYRLIETPQNIKTLVVLDRYLLDFYHLNRTKMALAGAKNHTKVIIIEPAADNIMQNQFAHALEAYQSSENLVMSYYFYRQNNWPALLPKLKQLEVVAPDQAEQDGIEFGVPIFFVPVVWQRKLNDLTLGQEGLVVIICDYTAEKVFLEKKYRQFLNLVVFSLEEKSLDQQKSFIDRLSYQDTELVINLSVKNIKSSFEKFSEPKWAENGHKTTYIGLLKPLNWPGNFYELKIDEEEIIKNALRTKQKALNWSISN